MSEPKAEPEVADKGKHSINERNLVVSFIQFLRHKVSSGNCTDSQIEAMEVAVQCLDSAFDVSDKNYAFQTSRPLLEIFKTAEGLPATNDELPTPLPAEIDQANRLKEEGNEMAKSGNWEEAINKYNEAIRLNRDPIYFCNRAAAYCRLEQNDLAIQDCRTAIALDPKYAKAWGRMGVALSNQARYAEAVEAYNKALEIDPENASYKQNLSIAQEKLREAESFANNSQRPRMPEGMNLGNILNNPQMMEMATQMISDPNVQNLMSQMMNSFMGGAAAGEGGAPPSNLEGFLRAGETIMMSAICSALHNNTDIHSGTLRKAGDMQGRINDYVELRAEAAWPNEMRNKAVEHLKKYYDDQSRADFLHNLAAEVHKIVAGMGPEKYLNQVVLLKDKGTRYVNRSHISKHMFEITKTNGLMGLVHRIPVDNASKTHGNTKVKVEMQMDPACPSCVRDDVAVVGPDHFAAPQAIMDILTCSTIVSKWSHNAFGVIFEKERHCASNSAYHPAAGSGKVSLTFDVVINFCEAEISLL